MFQEVFADLKRNLSNFGESVTLTTVFSHLSKLSLCKSVKEKSSLPECLCQLCNTEKGKKVSRPIQEKYASPTAKCFSTKKPKETKIGISPLFLQRIYQVKG